MSTDDYPWRDAETLRRLYWDEGLDQKEIADRFDCRKSTVSKWMRRHDVDRRDPSRPQQATDVLNNPKRLRELYHEREMNTTDIADLTDTSAATVSMWMDRHSIELRDIGDSIAIKKRRQIPYYTTTPLGYEKWQVSVRDDRHTVSVHRLVAVAEYGIEAVKDKVIHHKNHIPWDNRPENLEPMDMADHSRYHRLEYLANES